VLEKGRLKTATSILFLKEILRLVDNQPKKVRILRKKTQKILKEFSLPSVSTRKVAGRLISETLIFIPDP